MRSWFLPPLILFIPWFLGVCGFLFYIHSFQIPEILDCEAVVVFTGKINREIPGFELFKKSKAKRLLISGVDEGVKVHDLLPFPDVKQYAIDLGYEAYNTHTNAIETALWMRKHNLKSVCLVTNRYHMPRSLFQLRGFLKDETITPCPLTPPFLWWQDIRGFGFVLLEYHKVMLAYVLRLLR